MVQKDLLIFENYKDCSMMEEYLFPSHQTLVFLFDPFALFGLKDGGGTFDIETNSFEFVLKSVQKRKKRNKIFVIKSLLICKWYSE